MCLQRLVAAVAVDQLEEMAVQVHRVGHHRVVDEPHPHPLVAREAVRLGVLAELLAVHRPHEAFHVAGQVDVDAARRRARDRGCGLSATRSL